MPASERRGSAALLRVQDLGVSIASAAGPRALLDGLSFEASAGESVGIVGESGAGKSTLAMALLGLLPPRAAFTPTTRLAVGEHILDPARPESWRPLRGRRIGTVFQEPLLALDPAFTIGQQLREAVETHALDRGSAADDRAASALARVGFADAADALHRYPHELSGGMRQRALIAAAIVLEPALLIADEPTTALDVTLQAQVLDLLDDLRRSLGMTVLLISHDLDVIGERCQRALVLERGRIVEASSTPALLENAQSDAARRLAAARRSAKRPRATRVSVPAAAAPLLVATDIEVRFPAVAGFGARERRATQAVRGVSLQLQRGEALGIVGESGCGKSSLARAITALGPLTAGTLRFDAQALHGFDARSLRALRKRLQFVSQDAGASLTPHCRVRDLVGEGLEIHGLASGAERSARVDALLERFGLEARVADALPGELSSGQRQRVALARALAVEPELLVCDEPVAALDAPLRAEVLAHLDALRRERGLAIVLISHDLDAVRRIADRVLVMYHGRVVEAGDVGSVTSLPLMPYTQALLAAEPSGDPNRLRPAAVSGQVPAAVARINGCPFAPRCTHLMKDQRCEQERPALRSIAADRDVACWKV